MPLPNLYYMELVDEFGRNALMNEHYPTEVRKLLQKGTIDINAIDKNGNTALIIHIYLGNYVCVKEILEYCRDNNCIDIINYQTPKKLNALIYACYYSEKPAMLLLEAGADITIRDKYGRTALMIYTMINSISFGIPDIVTKMKSTINYRDNDGNTALMLYLICNNYYFPGPIINLLKNGTDIFIKNKNNQTVYDIFIQKTNSENYGHKMPIKSVKRDINNIRLIFIEHTIKVVLNNLLCNDIINYIIKLVNE